jgi:hypothetical protein
MNKNNNNRLKTDYIINQEDTYYKYDETKMNNMYNQMISHQYQGQVSDRHFLPVSASKSINLFNAKK